MQITLKIKEKDKTFTNDFVNARQFKNALKLNKEFKENNLTILDLDTYEKFAEFAVSVFNHQFTLDELDEGLPTQTYLSELQRVFNEVLTLGGLQVEGDEGNVQGE